MRRVLWPFAPLLTVYYTHTHINIQQGMRVKAVRRSLPSSTTSPPPTANDGDDGDEMGMGDDAGVEMVGLCELRAQLRETTALMLCLPATPETEGALLTGFYVCPLCWVDGRGLYTDACSHALPHTSTPPLTTIQTTQTHPKPNKA